MPKKPAAGKEKRPARVQRENFFQEGPYLIAALLCETVLVEKDNVKSAIRIVDKTTRVIKGTDPPSTMPATKIRWNLVIKLVKGKAQGKHEVAVKLVTPSGEELSTHTMTIDFEGAENTGIDLLANLDLDLKEEGIYWFEIYYDKWLLTKSPLQTTYFIQKEGSADSEQVH